MENILDDLTEEQWACMKKFRILLEDLDETIDDYFLYRFLKARNFDLPKAEFMIREHLKFRRVVGVDTILEDFVLPEVVVKYFPSYHIGTDKKGNGIISIRLGNIDVKGIVYSMAWKDHLKSLVYLLENTLSKAHIENKKTGQTGRKLILLLDFKGMQIMQLFDKRGIRHLNRIIMTFDRNYPETLESAYVINGPSFIPSYFNFLKKLVRSEALNKVNLYGSDGWKEELWKCCDPEMLPAVFGGKLCDPDGNVECRTMYCKGGKVPEDLYACSKYLFDLPEMDVRKVIVREKSYFNEEVFIKEPNTVLKWSFETVDNNIGFAVFYVPAGIKPMPKTSVAIYSKSFRYRVPKDPKEGHVPLVPLDRIDSQYMTEEGELLCQKSGIYLIHFDNTFSWMTSKKLYYKIDIIPSSNEIITDWLTSPSLNEKIVT